MKEPNLPVYCSHGVICCSSIFVIARNFHLVPLFPHNTKSWHGLSFPQAIGLSLRDLLARVDEEIHRLDPSSHKEVSMNLRERFFHFVTSMGQRKNSESPWRIEPQTFVLPLCHRDSTVSEVCYEVHMTRVLHTARISNVKGKGKVREKGKLANEYTRLGERHQDSRTFFFRRSLLTGFSNSTYFQFYFTLCNSG